MAKVRVAVVGCGNVSSGHIRAWRGEEDRAEIVALVDVVEEFAEARRTEFKLDGADVRADYAAVLARDDVDVVDVCTPSHLHAEQIEAAMAAGKHIVTEKPTGYNPEECRRLRWCARHHPDIHLAWGKVKLVVWTHKINGLAEADFIFAAKTDTLYPK